MVYPLDPGRGLPGPLDERPSGQELKRLVGDTSTGETRGQDAENAHQKTEEGLLWIRIGAS
jgi:hypothetical protein